MHFSHTGHCWGAVALAAGVAVKRLDVGHGGGLGQPSDGTGAATSHGLHCGAGQAGQRAGVIALERVWVM